MADGGVTRLDRLALLRDQQATALESDLLAARDFAAISREYRATLAEIADLMPKAKDGDAVDEIAQRRVARRSGATAGSSRTKRSG